MAETQRDWLLYPTLVLGVMTWPLWGIPDVVRDWRFQLRFRDAKDVRSFDGERIEGKDGTVSLTEVVGARAWTYATLSMASGAEESIGLELRLRDGSIRRYAGYALDGVYRALVAAGKVSPELENGGTSGGIGRPLMLGCWALLIAAALSVAFGG